ncbi:tripartite tricarboxylate transporter substrate binding protein [Halodesulfovibrio aestuarii]|uniref:Tripartite tricarboxylate transporter substrate binding protein n=1 Tax=Halodesulfovibrio aestuarii TaxID=126333 RepID=A0A8G2CAB6_9BACT|nr:tripartite tricarboxylate transporter substrate binding protein [Halodesulfovibrio aestuarii]SHJ28759.1 Tripartite-type tricarboxylate transporter, receptor component TctC [Halodesulfovibrio aestuarii]
MKKLLAFLMALVFAFPMYAMAEYPNKPITIIVPSKAGGSTDTTARIFINAAKKYWSDADFVVQDIPGSGGQKGFEAIARAKNDGYTIGLVFTTQVVSHIVSKRARYTLDSFHIIGNVVDDPLLIAVPKESPITDLAGFINKAQETPMTVAVNGIGSDDFIAAKKFENATGLTFNLLPTKGSTEQKALILGNHADASFMNLSQMQAQHKAGTARVIAILNAQRSDVLPEVKTAAEQGYDVNMTATRGFVAPAQTDKAILAKLDDLLAKVNSDPDFIADCKKNVFSRQPMSGKDYRAYLEGLQKETQYFYDKNPW